MNLKEMLPQNPPCLTCIDPEGWFDQPHWATRRKTLFAIGFLVVGFVLTLLAFWNASPIPQEVRSGLMQRLAISSWVICGLSVYICCLGLLPELAGKWHFAFRVNGKWHVHEEDPRKHLGSPFCMWVEIQETVDPELEAANAMMVIRGPIFRFRNGGALYKALYRFFRREDPNRIFWPVNGATGKIKRPMRLADRSSIYEVLLRGEDAARPNQMCVSLEQAFDVASRHLRLSAFLGDVIRESRMFRRLQLGHGAVIEYLKSTKDRRSSPVGKHARDLLEASAAELGITVSSASPQFQQMVSDTLAHLEALVAEKVTKEVETAPVR